MPHRNPVLATTQMAVSSHPLVSAAGLDCLTQGGNAVDAALAMAAVSWLALPGQCGVGGDAFAIVHEPDGEVWTVGGSGLGPDGGHPDFYRDQGLSAIPTEGALSVAAPGEIAALALLHERGATRSLSELWAPAVTAARRGVPCTAKTRADIHEHRSTLAADPTMSSVFLPRGRLPEVGERISQPDLADLISLLANHWTSLYQGELAQRSVQALVESGAPFTGEEWALAGTAQSGPSIGHRYGDVTVHATPPPTPGWMVLQQAALCDGELAREPLLGSAAVAAMASAVRRAFLDRYRHCGSDNDRWSDLLGDSAVATARAELHAAAATPLVSAHIDGDTTSVVTVDRDGRAVSLIHSLGFTFGARTTVPGTGMLLNNRLGRGAYLIAGHPNEVRPRRKPLHTLNAWLVTDPSGGLAHIGNTPGGDGQVQWNMQLLSHLLDHDLDPQSAVSAPRFTVHPGSDADTLDDRDELRCESRLGADVLEGLRARGENVRVIGPWAAGGSALVVSVDRTHGYLAGGADPRQDGVALGD